MTRTASGWKAVTGSRLLNDAVAPTLHHGLTCWRAAASSAWLCLDRALKCHLSRFKCGQFLPEINNFLVDSSQFGLGLFTHQVF